MAKRLIHTPFVQRIWRCAAGLLAGLLLVAMLPYALSPVYVFERPTPFSGSMFFNPYAGAEGAWRKANFHAHGYSWGGLTHGDRPNGEVVRSYRALGFDIAGLSNYQRIDGGRAEDPEFLPIYEHGYNLRKAHQLVIGAGRVLWLDFLFGSFRSQKQYLLDQLRKSGAVVAITHPSIRDAYSVDDFRFLTHYDLVEATHGSVAVQEFWDAALSTGHPVWIIGGQDSHHRMTAMWDGRPMGWSMVQTRSTRRDDVLSGLRAGRMYAVVGPRAANDILLRSVEVWRDSLIVTTDSGAIRFTFIGQGGEVRATVRDPRRAVYVLQPRDTYVRTVIQTPHTTILLNPVLRYDGSRLQSQDAWPDERRTWLLRTGLAAACVGLIGGVSRRRNSTGQ